MSNTPKTPTTKDAQIVVYMTNLKNAKKADDIRTALHNIAHTNGVVVDYSKKSYKELLTMKKAIFGTKPKKAKVTKVVTKADTTKEAKDIHSKLESITKAKDVIKTKHESIKQDVKTVIPMITAYVQKLRDEDKLYKEAKKTTLVKLVKARLASKEHVVNTVCDVMILGLNIDNTLPLSSMAFIVKCVNNGTFSKSKVNKADKVEIEVMITNQHKLNRIAIAKKLIG